MGGEKRPALEAHKHVEDKVLLGLRFQESPVLVSQRPAKGGEEAVLLTSILLFGGWET